MKEMDWKGGRKWMITEKMMYEKNGGMRVSGGVGEGVEVNAEVEDEAFAEVNVYRRWLVEVDDSLNKKDIPDMGG